MYFKIPKLFPTRQPGSVSYVLEAPRVCARWGFKNHRSQWEKLSIKSLPEASAGLGSLSALENVWLFCSGHSCTSEETANYWPRTTGRVQCGEPPVKRFQGVLLKKGDGVLIRSAFCPLGARRRTWLGWIWQPGCPSSQRAHGPQSVLTPLFSLCCLEFKSSQCISF